MDTLLNYPARGMGGNNKYRGNCSPLLISDLLDFYKYQQIADYMVGSGTTIDVARQKGIICNAYDLHSGFNLLTDDIKERNEFVFWHPPYHDMIKYADNMYSALEVQKKYGYNPNEYDLSQCKSWEEFIQKLNFCMIKQYQSLEKSGRMAVLMGDLKRKGKLYSMLLDIVKVGTVENVLIKFQHNTMSERKHYTSNNFIKIAHEYVLIVKKDQGLVYEIKLPKTFSQDIRNTKNATWKDVVADVLEEGKEMSLQEIYAKIEGFEKTKCNSHWKEKIRQTLQINPALFVSSKKGVWQLRKGIA